MESPESGHIIYEFGKFVLDPDEKILYADGVPLHLPAKEFETLLLLVVNNGRALSKEQMMTAIWQDAFVEESNLAKQISKLRKILDSNGEQLIETIPKHGYRFEADIRTLDGDAQPIIAERRTVRRVALAFDPDLERRALPPAPRSRRLAMIVGIFALLVAAGGFWYWRRQAPLQPSEIHSIAVLPLRSLAGSEEINALGVGMADSLITELGSLRHLVVRPIASVRNLAGSSGDALELGRKLNVDAVLDGTIQESNGRLRINARLVSTQTGEQVWAEKFDDNLTNVFEVQDRISEQAARALVATLSGAEIDGDRSERLTKRYTENPAAFDAYLKGRYYWNKRTEADFRRSIEQFERAVNLDPNYALAYSGLADAHILLAVWGTEPPRSSMEQAKQAAVKALNVDPDLAEARTSLAFVKWVYDWDFPAADAEFNRALELNPNYATAHHWRAYYLVSTGRGDEAIAEIRRAQELEGPLSLSIMTDIGEILCWAGKYDEAIAHLNEVVSVEPNYAVAHYELGVAYVMKREFGQAIIELERARQIEDGPRMISALAHAYGAAGRKQDAESLINELELESTRRYVSPFSIALAYAGIGDQEASIDWLEKARDERSDAMAILKVHPFLRALHSYPRFDQLTKQVGFTN